MPRAFLNYVGSKRFLLPVLDDMMPARIQRYFEPFVGGGSVTGHVLGGDGPVVKGRSYVNDMDPRVANCYVALRDEPREVARALDRLERSFAGRAGFDRVVRRFNRAGTRAKGPGPAADYIFLTKRSFNARLAFRRDGTIAPHYRDTGSALYTPDVLHAWARALAQCTVSCGDYEAMLRKRKPGKGDFVYLDPPYLVQSVRSYYSHEEDFGLAEFARLERVCAKLHRDGAKFALSVNDAPELRRIFKRFKVVKFVKPARMVHGFTVRELIFYN